jgi:hypothetical protein
MMVLLLSITAFAQTTASIKGTVTDPSGAAVVGATVTVKGVGVDRSTRTTSAGDYEVAALPPGTYSVQIEIKGFQSQIAKGVELEVSRNSVQNFSLKVAVASEVITVEAAAPTVEATTMTVGQAIDQNTVQEIPLNGRHFVDLALLVPGTVTPPQNGFLTAPLRGQGSFAFNSAGGREDAVNFMINGINLNDMVQNQVTFQPTINTVSEFKIDNSTYSAEYGRNSGSIVNIATRSGSNEFHGEAYEFLRNNFFDARNAFDRRLSSTGTPIPMPSFKRNQYGGDIGGPIVKDKTMFFLTYEGLKQRQGLSILSGVFPDVSTGCTAGTVSRQTIQTAGNALPNALLGLVPHANTTIGTQTCPNAFAGAAVAPVNIDQGTADISHKINDSDSLHGYYVFQHDLRQEAGAGTSLPGFGDTREGYRQVLTVNETHVFSSNVVNEGRIGANRIHITFNPNNTTTPASLGLSSTLGPNEQFMPTISVGDIGLLFGAERGFPQGRGDTTYAVADTLSYVHGRHSWKFGGEVRDFRNDNFNGDPGQLVFNTSAGFSAATVSSAARTVGNVANRINVGALDFFGMDSWKISPHVTLELGIRYAWNMTPSEAKNRFVQLVPIAGTGSLLVPSSEPYTQSDKNFQPRVGFAWDVFGKGNTILRGGYAYQVDQPITGVVTGLNSNPPFALPISVAANPVSALPALFNGTPASIAPLTVNPNFKDADVQSFNLNIQQQFGRDTGFMVGYFGSKGTHLEIDRNINQFTTLGSAASRPFTAISASSQFLPGVTLANTLTERDSSSNSNYNALWVTGNRRLSHGLQFNASYTWSHSIDDASRNLQGVVVQDSTNIGGSRGSSDFDARHRFVANAIYDLPFKGNRAVSGFQFAGIVTVQSGNPFTVVIPTNTITGLGNSVFATVTGPVVLTQNPLGQWITTSGFASPTTQTGFGNAGRNSFYGPGFDNLDLSLIKNTKLTEKINFQFRADVFDILNHPNYGQPSRVLTSLASTTFGSIGSTRFPTGDSGSSRQVQLAAKIQF